MKKNVGQWLQMEKAHANFNQIPLLCEAGYWDNVANRLYYLLFHAVSACLLMTVIWLILIVEL